ncbi:FG-GAP-like repeat-containing protein [Hymenobacter cheonanensis]|uniref:FG-GAP-like repeat-containing protein n=1 Tax=Hymenobacter sp. CA2-7 TaxID=3063993 RepID=UPI0027129672|nr:FG-GAP-like repeat-containing protein [Hymenobacter sp. CA2-7]MDO7885583.1 FG-GAP-like repeat-containing protein [Hymenobacter sp. CA2-7]
MLLSTNTLLKKLSSQTLFAALLGLPLLSSAQTISSFTPSTGPAGTSVLITGTSLTGTKSVMLNGQSLKITANALGSVTVTIPVAASTGKLVLTTASGVAVSGTQFGVTRSTSGVTFPQQTTKGSSFNTIKVTAASNSAVTGTYGAVFYSTPTIADLTNTGRTDLLIGNANGNVEYWKQTNVNGTVFSKVSNLQLGTGGDIRVANFAKPTVADIDGNGLLDMLVGTGDDRHIARFEQTAAGAITFTAKGNIQVPSGTTTADLLTGAQFPRPAVTDLDGDGRLDLLIGDYSGLLKRYEATAVNSTTFVADAGNIQADGANIKADGTAANGTAKPLIFDMDGNGLLDMVMGSQLGAITRYEQSARYATTFTSKGNLTTNGTTAINMGTTGNNEGGFAAPIITDIDNDGKLDMLIGDQNGTVYLYTQAQQTALTASPLPVTLTSFTAQNASAGTLLSWATATETNSASFEVQRSLDGASFATVGTLAGAGSSVTPRSYQYLDATAPAGTSYYRLRQVDLDGTVAYSAVAVLARPATGSAASAKALAFPVPFTDALSVALPGTDVPQAATVALLTLDGRTVYSRRLALSATPQALAELPTLAPGLYLLRTTTAAGTTTQRISRN